MSPGLIDIRTPTKPPSSSSSSSSLLENPNPNYQIFSSKSMNSSFRNANEGGGFDYSFASPSVSREEPVLRGGGRSVPRLVKVRKNASSNRGGRSRSRSIADSQIPFDFNPFCEGTTTVKVDDDSKFNELWSQYHSRNNSSGSSNSECFESGKPDGPGFVFGASKTVSNSNPEVLLQEEMKNLNFGNGNVKPKDNVYVFSSGLKKASSLDGNAAAASNLPDELRKLKIESVGGGEKNKENKADMNSFVFGRTGSLDTKLTADFQNFNIKGAGSDSVGNVEKKTDAGIKSKGSDRSGFVFGNDGNASGSFGSNAAFVLPDKMNKLNIHDTKIGGNSKVEETKDERFKVNDTNFFVFGGGKEESASLGGSMANTLRDEMSKLNMKSKTEKPSGFRDRTSTSSFSSQPKVSTDELPNDSGFSNSMRGTFIFEGTKPSRCSSVGSDSLAPQNDDARSSNGSTSSYSFYSAGLSFQSSGNLTEDSTLDSAGNTPEFAFGTPHGDFRTTKQDAPCSSATNLFATLDQKLGFSAKKGTVKDKRSKKKTGKVRKPASVPKSSGLFNIPGNCNIPSENNLQENADSFGCYSPMDVSPYQDPLASGKISRDTSVTSDEIFQLETDRPVADVQYSVSIDEDLITAAESLDINENNAKCEGPKEESMDNFRTVHVPGVESEYLNLKTKTFNKTNASVTASERDHSHENDSGMEFCFASSSENMSGKNFTFAASTSVPGNTSTAKRHYKKKTRLKAGPDPYHSTLNAKLQFASPDKSFLSLPGHSSDPVTEQNKKEDSSLPQFMGENRVEANEGPRFKHESISRAPATAVAHEACEKWRLRGNQAYANGDLSKAEDYYTRGLNCVPKDETSEDCLTALALCYSNRAAARMSSGRMRAALEDCKRAAEINPDFRKVQVRAANCHLALGEIDDALQNFKNALPPGADLCLDRKIVIEASNGLQKAQQARKYLDRCSELLQRRTPNDAESVLQVIAEALLISPYSEKIIELKAQALLMLRKYEETIQLCEESLDSAEKNSFSESGHNSESLKNCTARLWRWHLIAKSHFYLGRLEDALSFLEKLEQAGPFTQKFGSKTSESSSTLAVTVRELLRHKTAGNEAFQSGRHSEAVEHYTSALSCNLESRPFAAICFCNRAAAYQALDQITDAIADCSLAIALDGNYPKAISRRATLHEMIRDYSQAAIDLQRLVSLLEKQTGGNINQSGKLGRSTSGIIDLRQAHSRLSGVEEEAKKGITLNLYLILGIDSSSVGSDIKKAYRKAALRHHPDKAAQGLPRSDNGDDGVWKEIAEVVYKDADRLFKMIGEAYAVLSDPVKRFQYDDEEIRHVKKGNGCSTSRTSSDVYGSPFERSASRRQETRRSYRNQYPHWSESTRSDRYF